MGARSDSKGRNVQEWGRKTKKTKGVLIGALTRLKRFDQMRG